MTGCDLKIRSFLDSLILFLMFPTACHYWFLARSCYSDDRPLPFDLHLVLPSITLQGQHSRGFSGMIGEEFGFHDSGSTTLDFADQSKHRVP